MYKRASRIVLKHLRDKISQTEESLTGELLTESEIEEAIQDALNTLYGSLINNWLRNQSIEFIFSKMYDLVLNFSEADSAQKLLDEELKNKKNDMIRIIENIAKSDKGSITDLTLNHFRANPTSNRDDISNFIRKLLNDAKRL